MGENPFRKKCIRKLSILKRSAKRRTTIVDEMNIQLEKMEQKARERIVFTVDHVLTTLLT
jgi:hypothetical protein